MRFASIARAVLGLMLSLVVATPLATAAQTPDATAAGQFALYQAEQAVLVGDGGAIVDLFLNGNEAAFLDRSSDEVKDALSDVPIERLLGFLETNRLVMDVPATGGQFGGHYNGGSSISGYYLTDTGSSSFRMTTEELQDGAVPTGHWTGTIRPEGTEFSVDFTGSADSLTATIDIPSLGIEAAPVEHVVYATEQPVGEVVARQALPISPTLRIYAEVREWGPSRLVFSTVLDDSGAIRRFRFTPVRLSPAEDDTNLPGTGTTYRLPADQPLFVYWGGQGELTSHHDGSPGQLDAYEFMIWKNGSIHEGDGSQNADYHVWDIPVVAPVAGTVVAVENGVPDHAPGDSAESDSVDAVSQAGNYIVIQVAPEEWVVLAHLQQGSIEVAVGDQVQPGEQLARVGNSGSSGEPSLHMHAQAAVHLDAPEGSSLRLIFAGYVANAGADVPLGIPVRGQFVAPAAASSG